MEKELLNSFNFNYNRLVALDIRATTKEILEVSICPLNNRFEIAKSIIPFNILIKPHKSPFDMKDEKKEIRSMKCTIDAYYKAFNQGIPLSDAAELFERWCKRKIKMLEGRKLMVLTYDWATKKRFLIDWLGPLHVEEYFHFHIRDILSISLFANDHANVNYERCPYPKVDVRYIYSQTKTEYQTYDTLVNCYGLAKIYKELLFRFKYFI